MGVLDEMMEGVEQPVKEKTLWEKTKETISNIPSDVTTSAKEYVTGAVQGFNELTAEGNTLAENNPLALSGTPMGEGITNAPAPEQTTEQQQASEQYQEASNQFLEGTIKPPLLPLALAGNSVAGILYAPFMVADINKSYNEVGGGLEGVKKVARDFTYGGIADFATQQELASKFQSRPIQTTVNGILSIAPPLLMGMGAVKAARGNIGKTISSTDTTTPAEYNVAKDMGIEQATTVLPDTPGERVTSSIAENVAKDIEAPTTTVETAPSIKGNDIISSGEKQLGKPYELGSDGINATDCGKFTQDTLAENGINLDYRTADGQYLQMEKEGKVFNNESEAQVGDLVFFDVPSNRDTWVASNDPAAVNSSGEAYKGITHVGIYAGEGKVLQAGSHGVSYADINAFGDIVGFAKTAEGTKGTRIASKTETVNDYNETAKRAEESTRQLDEESNIALANAEKYVTEKQPWEMTKEEYAANNDITSQKEINQLHEQEIAKAAYLGENIPDNVINEYPEIKAGNISHELLQKAFNPTKQYEAVGKLFNGIKDTFKDVESLISPASVSNASRITARTMRENMSATARKFDIAEKSMDTARKYFSGAGNEKSIKFIDAMEKGTKQDHPALDQFSKIIRDGFDKRVKEVQSLGTGKLENAIVNYFPHIWENPKQAETFYGKYFSKRPLEGSKSFLKQRKIPTTVEGIEQGLKPVSYNPVDLALLKMREMDKYIMAHKVLNELKSQGLVKFSSGKAPEEGWIKIDDKISTVFSKNENGELILKGNFYAQPDAAKLINNYLSPGLSKYALANGIRSVGNKLNAMQLGMSAFHLGFTSLDAMVSKVALATKQLAAGDFKESAKSFVEAPLAPLTTAIKGGKYKSEWYNPDGTEKPLSFLDALKGDKTIYDYFTKGDGAEVGTIMDALSIGGARARMDSFYQTKIRESAVDSFRTAVNEYKNNNNIQAIGYGAKAAIQGIAALPEALPKLIMEQIVPRQKLGVAASMMKWELDRNPNMSHAELQKVASEVWDSVDNRLGQLAYDNLFWNKTFKDSLMLSVRSVGWNVGTWREVGGGLIDTAKASASLIKAGVSKAKGEEVIIPEYTHRMSYIVGLGVTTAITGAIYQYLATGQLPQELKDYFFPRTGDLDKNGRPDRVSLPSYVKDLYHMYNAPTETITNKLHPMWSAMSQIWNNKDFYSTEIRHSDDPITKQIQDVAKFIAKQAIPFSVQSYNKQGEAGSSTAKKALSFIGITSAPGNINMTEAEKLSAKFVKEKIPAGTKTKEQAEKADLERKIGLDIQKGSFDSLNVAKQSGQISSDEYKKLRTQSKTSPLQRQINHLSADEAIQVYKVATPDEQQLIKGEIKKKIANKLNNPSALTPAQKQDLKDKMVAFR